MATPPILIQVATPIFDHAIFLVLRPCENLKIYIIGLYSLLYRHVGYHFLSFLARKSD
jgi:hypothetical protein